MQFKIDVRPTATESAIAYAPFDEALERLEKEGFSPISLAQNAELRIQQGKDSGVARNGNWVREGVLYIPNKGNFLVRNSPILQAAREATKAHGEGKEFYLNQTQVDEALTDSVAFPPKDIQIPVKRFGEEELTVYSFGAGDASKAQAYGDFLKDAGINKMPIYAVSHNHVSKQSIPFARQLGFRGLGDESFLNGNGGDLRSGYRLRGVRSVSNKVSK